MLYRSLLALSLVAAAVGCQSRAPEPASTVSPQQKGDARKVSNAAWLAENARKPGVKSTASGLQYRVLSSGKGKHPRATDQVTVNYRGSLIDGTVFDASERHGGPATFPLNRVIKGWTEGLQLMTVGEKRRLWVPEGLAYKGEQEPRGMLVFDVELLAIVH